MAPYQEYIVREPKLKSKACVTAFGANEGNRCDFGLILQMMRPKNTSSSVCVDICDYRGVLMT